MGAQQTVLQRVQEARQATEIAPAPLAARSGLGARIAEGTFVTMVEIVPPKGIVCDKEIEGARSWLGAACT